MDHGKNDMEILEATDDAYGGVIVDVRKKMDPPTFVALLRASISRWRQQVYIFHLFFLVSLLVVGTDKL